jgi:transposase
VSANSWCAITDNRDSIVAMDTADSIPDDINALRAELAAERAARREAEARASGAEAMVAHLKLVIAKLEHHRYGASSERGRKLLEQAELQLEELEADAAEAAIATEINEDRAGNVVTRRKPVRGPLPAHLPRERVVIPGPTACPCCGGALCKLGETVTETLESIPRRWKVIQTVREKLVCRACETITQPPAPFHPIARGAPAMSLRPETRCNVAVNQRCNASISGLASVSRICRRRSGGLPLIWRSMS